MDGSLHQEFILAREAENGNKSRRQLTAIQRA